MSKARKAKTFTIRAYRVNGVLEIPVEAHTPAEARREAARIVQGGVKMQPGGPTLCFGETFRTHFITVRPEDVTEQPFIEKGPTP